MHPDQLIALICDPARTLDEVAATLEATLAPDQIDPDVLLALRSALREQEDQQLVVRGMLVGARLAPRAVANALDIYGMWVNRANEPPIDLNLLRVAAWAYHWDDDPMGRARALVNLADGLFGRDAFAEALATAQAALDFFLSVNFTPGIEMAMLLQAGIFIELQQPAQAEALLAALQGTLEPVGAEPDTVIRYVERLNARAFTAENLRDDFALARQFYDQAEALLPHTGAEHPFAGSAFRLSFNRGLLEQRLGRHAEARRCFEQAEHWLQAGLAIKQLKAADAYDLHQAQLLQALLLDDRPLALSILQTLAALLRDGKASPKQRAEFDRFAALLSEQIEDVVRLMNQAITTFKALGADLLALACSSQLTERAYQAGRPDLAAPAFAAAWHLLSDYPAPRRRLELSRIAAQYDPALSLSERQRIATELVAAGDLLGATAVYTVVGQAWEQAGDPQAARAAYTQALEVAAQARGMLRLSLHTLRHGATRRRAAERAFALAPNAATAFMISEQLRAQTLLDEVSNAGLWRLLEHADLAEIKAAYEQLSYLQAGLSLREFRGRRPTLEHTPNEAPPTVTDRQRAEATYFAALDRIANAKAARVGWISGRPATPPAIAAALPPGSLLVALNLIGSASEGELWATLLDTHASPQVLRLADQRRWRIFIQRWGEGFAAATALSTADANAALIELYRTFIAPISHVLPTAAALIIALDESLPLYPLHAAYDGEHYLLERLPVSYVPSGSVLALLRQRHLQRTPPAQHCFVGYDAAAERDYPTLNHAPAELATLAQIVAGSHRHGPFAPSDLLAQLRQARLVHLLAHGEFPLAASPRFARLITGPQPLYADDLYRSPLSADLIFLDACHSGQVGPGMQGFVGAALVSGASAVIAAMWQVHYDHARPLVRAFYTHWRDGVPGAAALCQAQAALARSHPPQTWAPFAYTGIPDLPFKMNNLSR